jgi:hypothetical protein
MRKLTLALVALAIAALFAERIPARTPTAACCGPALEITNPVDGQPFQDTDNISITVAYTDLPAGTTVTVYVWGDVSKPPVKTMSADTNFVNGTLAFPAFTLPAGSYTISAFTGTVLAESNTFSNPIKIGVYTDICNP